MSALTTWEYATVPLIVHATKAILDQWGADGWELVQVVPGPDGTSLVLDGRDLTPRAAPLQPAMRERQAQEAGDPAVGARPGDVGAPADPRVGAGAASVETLRRVLRPRTPGGVTIPLFLPSVVTRWERDPFTLASINLDSVEALGQTFAKDNAPTLTRKAYRR